MKENQIKRISAAMAAGENVEQIKEKRLPEKNVNDTISSKPAQAENNEILADRLSQTVVSEIAEDRISAPAGATTRDRSIRKVASTVEENVPGHIPPQPVNGKPEFDKYIRENIHQPDSLITGQSKEVSLSFLVRADGSLDMFRIISSPGKQYSDEAIRLIKSGPAWKPARQSGKQVDDRVKVRIVF